MLQYSVVLLDDTSVSYCHAINPSTTKRLMPLSMLRKAIFFSMRHNLMVQYVLPPYQLPQEYYQEMNTIDHLKIGMDVSVYHCIPKFVSTDTVVLCLPIETFIENVYMVSDILRQTKRVCIHFTNIETFRNESIGVYEACLNILKETIIEVWGKGKKHELNIITDRLTLSEMSNCNAGVNNITIAPNGKFYICPAFYYDELSKIDSKMNYKNPIYDRSVGDLDNGIDLKNKQLLNLKNAPLCKTCEAFHCHRCVWLNQKLTNEINTPSHEQCVISHIEMRVAKSLSDTLRDMGIESQIIKDVDFLDPFEQILKY